MDYAPVPCDGRDESPGPVRKEDAEGEAESLLVQNPPADWQQRRRMAKARAKQIFANPARVENNRDNPAETTLETLPTQELSFSQRVLSLGSLPDGKYVIVTLLAAGVVVSVAVWMLATSKNAGGYLLGVFAMLCLAIIARLTRQQSRPELQEYKMLNARPACVQRDMQVTRHLQGHVVVLRSAVDTTEIKQLLRDHWDDLAQLSLGDKGFDKVGRSPPFYRELIDPEAMERYMQLPEAICKSVESILATSRFFLHQHAPHSSRSHLVLSRSFIARNPNEVGWHTDGGECSLIMYCGGSTLYGGGEIEFQDPHCDSGAAAVSLQPIDGDIVLFDTNLFHRVRSSTLGERPTAMIFFSEDGRYFSA